MKYPPEEKFGPTNTHEGTMAQEHWTKQDSTRWHETHKV